MKGPAPKFQSKGGGAKGGEIKVASASGPAISAHPKRYGGKTEAIQSEW